MIARIAARITVLAFIASLAPFAMAQQAAKTKAPESANLDAAPAKEAAPDPLAPPEQEGPAPSAPGAPAEKPAEKQPEAAQAPVPEPDPVATQILARAAKAGSRGDAREDIAGLTAYYNATKGQPIWISDKHFSANAQKAIREIRSADDWGLDASAFQIPASPGAGASPQALADAEIKLSLAVLKYARHARGGRLDPPSISEIIDRRPHIYDPKSVLAAIAAAGSADAYLRGLHPKHEQFKRLRQALLAMNGGGNGSASSGRLPQGPNARSRSSFNQGTDGAPSERKLRILINMERWRWMPDELGSFYVWDSIPEQVTRVFDRGKVVLMERIVVGRQTTPTPTFSANMQFVTFNPEWAVPEGIKVNEIAPKLQQAGGGGNFYYGYGGGGSSQILQRLGGLRVNYNGREIDPDSVDWSSVDIRRFQFIQGPGERNVLGVVKFRFPNKHDVYMHDTPDRHLFNQTPRTFSHGCMRTENPLHLAEVILGHDKGYSPGQIREMVQAGVTNEIKLHNVIPVHVAYFTAEVDDQGQLHYFPDVYGLDSRVASALRGQPVRFSSDQVASAESQDRRQAQRNDPYQRYDPYQRSNPYQRNDPYQGYDPYQRGRDPRYQPRGQPWNPFQDWN